MPSELHLVDYNRRNLSESKLLKHAARGQTGFLKFLKHFFEFFVVGADGKVLNVEVVAIAILFVFVVGNLNLFATKLSLISVLNAGLSILFAQKLNKAETAGFAVVLFELE